MKGEPFNITANNLTSGFIKNDVVQMVRACFSISG